MINIGFFTVFIITQAFSRHLLLDIEVHQKAKPQRKFLANKWSTTTEDPNNPIGMHFIIRSQILGSMLCICLSVGVGHVKWRTSIFPDEDQSTRDPNYSKF